MYSILYIDRTPHPRGEMLRTMKQKQTQQMYVITQLPRKTGTIQRPACKSTLRIRTRIICRYPLYTPPLHSQSSRGEGARAATRLLFFFLVGVPCISSSVCMSMSYRRLRFTLQLHLLSDIKHDTFIPKRYLTMSCTH